MDHLIGLALGSNSCDVAVRRGPGSTGSGGTVPTTLAFRPDGSVLVGEAAEEQAESDPADVLRDFVRRVGDRTPIVVAGRALTAADAVALFVDGVVAEVRSRLGLSAPTHIALAHPVGWTGGAVERVLAALSARGLRGVMPVPAPLAAVAARGGLRGPVAIIDVGTDLAVSVVEAADRRAANLLGPPITVPHHAGPVWDDLVLAQVRSALGAAWARLDPADARVRTAMAELRRRCTHARKRLSATGFADVEVELPGVRARVSLDRGRFDERVGAALAEVVVSLGSALETAGVAVTELAHVVLTGDSAPLVASTLSEALERPVVADPAPLAAIGVANLCEAACASSAAPNTGARVRGPRHALQPDSSATGAVAPIRSRGSSSEADGSSSAPRHSAVRTRRAHLRSRKWLRSWYPAAVSRHSSHATG
jgi:molecular chaperone DnaK (HSP70)